MAKGRAENKVLFTMWIDKDLRAKFKEVTEQNKTKMAKVLLECMINYVEEHSEEKDEAD